MASFIYIMELRVLPNRLIYSEVNMLKFKTQCPLPDHTILTPSILYEKDGENIKIKGYWFCIRWSVTILLFHGRITGENGVQLLKGRTRPGIPLIAAGIAGMTLMAILLILPAFSLWALILSPMILALCAAGIITAVSVDRKRIIEFIATELFCKRINKRD